MPQLKFLSDKEVDELRRYQERATREDIEIEKGIVITEPYLEEHEALFRKYMDMFIVYPDLFLDLISPADSNFKLYFYQRIFLRACMRYRYHYVTACRAFSKTFLSLLALYLECIFLPGTKRFICAPGKGQSAKIARDKLFEIWEHFPLLKQEIIGEGAFGKDYIRLVFRNGSIFDVVGALDSERGGRRQGGLVDEVRDHDGDLLSSVVLPLMNVARRMQNGQVNQREPNAQQLYMTSAGVKSSFAYDKLIDIFENSIIDPQTAFVWGCSYKVPVKHGLLDKAFIQELKMSPSYSVETFAKEYLSHWGGGAIDSWFNFETMLKYRKLKNPENKARQNDNSTEFYLLSVDVGRLHDQTTCCVFRVNQSHGKYVATLVNLFVFGLTPETRTFEKQTIDLKKKIREFNPREVVIDCNGLITSSFKTLLIAGISF